MNPDLTRLDETHWTFDCDLILLVKHVRHVIPLGNNHVLEVTCAEDAKEYACTAEIIKNEDLPRLPNLRMDFMVPVEVRAMAQEITEKWLDMGRHSDGVWFWTLEK